MVNILTAQPIQQLRKTSINNTSYTNISEIISSIFFLENFLLAAAISLPHSFTVSEVLFPDPPPFRLSWLTFSSLLTKNTREANVSGSCMFTDVFPFTSDCQFVTRIESQVRNHFFIRIRRYHSSSSYLPGFSVTFSPSLLYLPSFSSVSSTSSVF